MSDVPWIARTHRLAGCPELDEVDTPPPPLARARLRARVGANFGNFRGRPRAGARRGMNLVNFRVRGSGERQ